MKSNIRQIIEIQQNDSKEYGAFEKIVQDNQTKIEDLYSEILLAKVSETEYQLEQWVLDNDAENLYIELTKKNSSGGDLPYYGFWSVEVTLRDNSGLLFIIEEGEEPEQQIDSLDRFFRHFQTLAHNYKTNEINSANQNTFMVPLNDLSKLYDFFLPEKVLKEYRAGQLTKELGEQDLPQKKRNKL